MKIKAAILAYATSISAGPANSGAKIRWMQNAMQNSDMLAQQMHPSVVYDPGIQSAGATADDATISAAVQAVANAMM